MYISSLTVAIPVHYSSDFQEPFEATLYIPDAGNGYYQIIMHYRYGSSKTNSWLTHHKITTQLNNPRQEVWYQIQKI
jgi:hypothetical protein